MQTEGFHEAGRNLAAEAFAAEGALKDGLDSPGCEELEERDGEWSSLQESRAVPQDRAIRGLAMAVPISLAMWMVIGALLWALTR